jgi:ABC-type Mn2+/Zn2+ transport system ATPase subunit
MLTEHVAFNPLLRQSGGKKRRIFIAAASALSSEMQYLHETSGE